MLTNDLIYLLAKSSSFFCQRRCQHSFPSSELTHTFEVTPLTRDVVYSWTHAFRVCPCLLWIKLLIYSTQVWGCCSSSLGYANAQELLEIGPCLWQYSHRYLPYNMDDRSFKFCVTVCSIRQIIMFVQLTPKRWRDKFALKRACTNFRCDHCAGSVRAKAKNGRTISMKKSSRTVTCGIDVFVIFMKLQCLIPGLVRSWRSGQRRPDSQVCSPLVVVRPREIQLPTTTSRLEFRLHKSLTILTMKNAIIHERQTCTHLQNIMHLFNDIYFMRQVFVIPRHGPSGLCVEPLDKRECR